MKTALVVYKTILELLRTFDLQGFLVRVEQDFRQQFSLADSATDNGDRGQILAAFGLQKLMDSDAFRFIKLAWPGDVHIARWEEDNWMYDVTVVQTGICLTSDPPADPRYVPRASKAMIGTFQATEVISKGLSIPTEQVVEAVFRKLVSKMEAKATAE